MEEWDACLKTFHVFPWQLIKLKPSNIKLMTKQMEEFENPIQYEFREDGKELFDMLQLGGNFVVPIVQRNVEMIDLIVFYNVSDLHSIWFVNLLHVFGVVSLKHVIML